MIEGRLAHGPVGLRSGDAFCASLGAEPLGELAPDGLEIVQPGEAAGPLVGGTLDATAGVARDAVSRSGRPPGTCCSSTRWASGRTGCIAC